MKQIQNAAALFFIFAVGLLTVISVMGIWDVFSHDVITKSFETIGLLAFVSIIIIVAGQFIGDKSNDPNVLPVAPNPLFPAIRKFTLGVLIASVAILALLGIMAIWDFISNKDVISKSLGSVATLAFSSFVIVMTCLQLEENQVLKKKVGGSAGLIVLVLFIGFIFIGIFAR